MLDNTADFLTVKLGQDTTWMGHRLATPGFGYQYYLGKWPR